MKLLKDITDITFEPDNPMGYGPFNDPDIEVSEPIVMKSAAGWYVGTICRRYNPYFIRVDYNDMNVPEEVDWYTYEPYDRYTVYYDTPYIPSNILLQSKDPNPNHRLCLTSVIT